MKKLLLSAGFVLGATVFNLTFFSADVRAQFSRQIVLTKTTTKTVITVGGKTSGASRPAVVQSTMPAAQPKPGQNGKIVKSVPLSFNIAALERRVLELVNIRRRQYGLQPVIWNSDAARVARIHSQNMAAYNFFSHQGRDGKRVNERADAGGLRKWQALGENIAYNRGYGSPLESAVQSWMNSPGHRENILNNRWQQSGVGIALTANGTYYFTEVFLRN